MDSSAEKRVERHGLTGSAATLIGGAAAVVLTILGLVGVNPATMIAVAAIAVGVALMVESGSFATEYSRLLAFTGRGRLAEAELGGGLGAEAVSGLAAAVLGVLALIGISPDVLMAVAVVVLGAGLMFGGGVTERVRTMRSGEESERTEIATRRAVATAEGAQVLVGISAVVLGILALVGYAPTTLVLIGLLATGGSLLLSAASIGSRFYGAFGSHGRANPT